MEEKAGAGAAKVEATAPAVAAAKVVLPGRAAARRELSPRYPSQEQRWESRMQFHTALEGEKQLLFRLASRSLGERLEEVREIKCSDRRELFET